ncbi:protein MICRORCHIDIA 7-like [Nicotiana tomentosiformis]|uniref:protein MICRORCHIDIA 7-like n=1 Tax=Nicotiana tomentosiformis TaxID=4098 RepID=UPI00388CB320
MITMPIKQEIVDPTYAYQNTTTIVPTNTTDHMIPINDGFGSYFDDIEGGTPFKKMKVGNSSGIIAPLSIRPKAENHSLPVSTNELVAYPVNIPSCKQFWKAGDYDGTNGGVFAAGHDHTVGMDHVRVHPKFLHSNATSHKWALGAFAELLDNAMDEVCNGATYVSVDVLDNKKQKGKMLLVEDNGGGMTPDRMRQCMSLGYSVKSKLANTIGQYGNGFKTSSMRLGADVIVFSRVGDRTSNTITQSVGMLSYTFLRSTGKEDIVVPMIDFVKREETWETLIRSSADDWRRNSETIVQWSPYESEEDLFQQFELLNKDQGTRVIIYNLWEDEEGCTELDFDADPHDIQIRGVSRDEKKIQMATEYPNSRHFLTYQHSLRSYASILYLRLAPGFRIILRGKDVEHHNLVNDMMLSEEITYRPQCIGYETLKDPNVAAVVTIGFVKDAKQHIDVQGFNVYHKNRLIKPFWRVWNAAGSDGRGVIGVLEANFVEPAHDKQGFERTIVLARLEARLQAMQKKYWSSNCHFIGYAKRRNVKNIIVSPPEEESNTTAKRKSCSQFSSNGHKTCHDKSTLKSTGKERENVAPVHPPIQVKNQAMSAEETQQVCVQNASAKSKSCSQFSSNGHTTCHDKSTLQSTGGERENVGPVHSSVQARNQTMSGDQTQQLCGSNRQTVQTQQVCESNRQTVQTQQVCGSNRQTVQTTGKSVVKMEESVSNLREENHSTKSSLQQILRDLQYERVRSKTLVWMLLEERRRRDKKEESLRSRLKDASVTIEQLLNKVRLLESRTIYSCKREW